MTNKDILGGTVHQMPNDLKKAITSSPKAREIWQSLTPLARNEWICWTISVKQQKTRDDHVRRVPIELLQGKRRPCCWIGCLHRPDKPISKSVQGILAKKSKTKP
jgi:hypothetical protein